MNVIFKLFIAMVGADFDLQWDDLRWMLSTVKNGDFASSKFSDRFYSYQAKSLDSVVWLTNPFFLLNVFAVQDASVFEK